MRRAIWIGVGLAWVALLALPAGATAAGPGKIFGTVTPTAIAPEVEVCLVEARPSETCTSPGTDGEYTLSGLPVSTPLRIEFIPSYRSGYAIQYFENGRTLGEATVITLSPGTFPEKRGVNAKLELGGAIEGHATAESGGAALPGVEVCVVEGTRRAPSGCTETNEAGEYRLGSLAPGNYIVGFFGHDGSAEYATVYYGGQTTPAQATPVTVAAGETVAGIDAAMAKGAKINGTVSAAASGVPLEGTPVCVFAGAASVAARCVYTEASGSYSFLGLSPGSYQVGFSLNSAEIGGETVVTEDDGYLTQYYDRVANRSEARTLTLSGEQVDTGIDAQLLSPTAPPPLLPPPPIASNVVAAPLVVAEPSKPKPLQCKKGFKKKKVKGVARCVKKKPPKKHRRHPAAKKHRKHRPSK